MECVVMAMVMAIACPRASPDTRLLLGAGLLLCPWLGGSSAQYFHQPQLAYEPMTFDLVHRGTFNMSYCSRELLNCWEIIKADHMCGSSLNLNTYYGRESEDNRPKTNIWFFGLTQYDDLMRWSVYESVCGVKREYCDDERGDQDLYRFEFGLFEHYCPNPDRVKESLGRRSDPAARGARGAPQQRPKHRELPLRRKRPLPLPAPGGRSGHNDAAMTGAASEEAASSKGEAVSKQAEALRGI